MANQLFKLRGKLPATTYLIIEIIGVILLLLIWQLIASVGTTEERAFEQGQLNVYYSNPNPLNELKDPQVLIYDKAVLMSNDLVPLFEEVAALDLPLLLITNEANKRAIHSMAMRVKGLQIVAAQADAPQRAETFNTISNFTGSSIINDDFFEEGEEVALSTNFLGTSDNIQINNGTFNFQNSEDWISSSLLPSPVEVLKSYKPLFNKDNLIGEILYSVGLNVGGYIIAVLIALPLGFIIGLFPLFRALFSRQVDALRFIPLTAVTGLFIAWFGIGSDMKVLFLAFGIIVYLLPVVVQRIDEVEKVYLQTVYTLGASKWQKIRSVFIPAVLSKISDDVRVLVAISWTYIIVAELVNKTGGIGALIHKSARQSQIDKVFAILLIIILIGFIQDKLFVLFDRLFFPYKYKNR